MMFLKNINLKNSSFSIKNLIFNLLKKYLVGGNFFLDQNLSKTYLVSNKKGFVISGTTIDIPKIIKSKILFFLIKNFCLPIPFMNFKNFKTGSDAHYTSSLFDYNKKNKILNDCSELISMKNFYILDGSVIPPGLNYPTFFQVLNNFVKLKKIKRKIFNEKK